MFQFLSSVALSFLLCVVALLELITLNTGNTEIHMFSFLMAFSGPVALNMEVLFSCMIQVSVFVCGDWWQQTLGLQQMLGFGRTGNGFV